MPILTVTAKGQVTLRKDVLQHLGVRPGDTLTVDKLPGGQIAVKAARRTGKISDLFGSLKRKGQPSLSIEEINEAIAQRLGWRGVKIVADTNVLVRAFVADDVRQARLAQAELSTAELVAVTLPTLCELTWVLSRSYRLTRADIAGMIRGLQSSSNVALDDAAVDAGLTILDAGGDFADGVIAHAGKCLGGDVLVSFDKAATALLAQQGAKVRALV